MTTGVEGAASLDFGKCLNLFGFLVNIGGRMLGKEGSMSQWPLPFCRPTIPMEMPALQGLDRRWQRAPEPLLCRDNHLLSRSRFPARPRRLRRTRMPLDRCSGRRTGHRPFDDWRAHRLNAIRRDSARCALAPAGPGSGSGDGRRAGLRRLPGRGRLADPGADHGPGAPRERPAWPRGGPRSPSRGTSFLLMRALLTSLKLLDPFRGLADDGVYQHRRTLAVPIRRGPPTGLGVSVSP